ncbi:hypothetical protein HPB52_005430 [Rhipicephalus sanguineus]|uniref:Uncharacterized protein n=1 Tax=Rhipicephalus sanguineus TaxID=34632 RepID=A0A9D4QGP0_RHISA|nr:hypothetical protein HPB52_005430 [Rhipicephalus sanguineus]
MATRGPPARATRMRVRLSKGSNEARRVQPLARACRRNGRRWPTVSHARRRRPTGIRGRPREGGEDGTRFTHVPPRNNRRDDIAEAGPHGRAATTSLADAGRRSRRHEEDAISRTDRKY